VIRSSKTPVYFPLVFAGVVLGALPSACSAGYQSLYEGDVRFEHCYRLDEEPSASRDSKRGCWQEWSRSYTYGQTRDRVEYALGRVRVLGKSDNEGHPHAAKVPPIACPMPTSAFVTPPHTLGVDAAAPGAPMRDGDGDGGAIAPGADCSSACSRSWDSCGKSCSAPTCTSRCDEIYRSCMRGCF
jgi:hypothetical protein